MPASRDRGDSGYPIVWWDPATLRLDVDAHFGIRQEELLSKDAPEATVARDLSRYEEWKQSRDAAVARAAEPSLVVRLVTEHAEHGSTVPEVEIVELPVARDRPSGVRFGSLVHAVLASVPLDGTVESDPSCWAPRAYARCQRPRNRCRGICRDGRAGAPDPPAGQCRHDTRELPPRGAPLPSAVTTAS